MESIIECFSQIGSHAKDNKPVKPDKEHWKSGIQSKFLDATLQKKCQTQAELDDWWKYKRLEMSKEGDCCKPTLLAEYYAGISLTNYHQQANPKATQFSVEKL